MSIGDRAYVNRQLGRLRSRRFREPAPEDPNNEVLSASAESLATSSDPEIEFEENRNDFFLNNLLNEISADELSYDESDYEEHDVEEQDQESEQEPETSDDELIDDVEDRLNDIEELRQWALMEPPISHTRLEELLKILRRARYPELPKCAKTFLGTDNSSFIIEKLDENDSGEFVYFGIEENLKKCVNPEVHEINSLQLLINIDGLPLYKSSDIQFWPVFAKIYNQSDVYKPFPVAIYCGKHKPSNVESYLRKFRVEINHLLEVGVQIDGILFTVSIKAFICDRPARAFIKCIKGHGGYWACERCEVKGQRVEGRTIYPVDPTQCILRTDHSFRNQTNQQHHTGVSPLINITPHIDMVNDFCLDSMHLVYIGIVKKILDYWLNSNVKSVKLSNTMKNVLTNLLLQLKHQVPQDFQRTTRSLDDIAKFKATELQFILLYVGPIIFKQVLSEDVYRHFLLLHVGIRLLCSKDLATQKLEHAKHCLKLFVTTSKILYGKTCLVSNMHNLIHLADDVDYMNCTIPEVSGYPFESFLGKLKKFIRNGNRPLSQICRRLSELSFKNTEKVTIPVYIKILRQLSPDEENNIPIKSVQYKGSILTSKHPDNTVLLENNNIMQIDNIFKTFGENLIKISGIQLRKKSSIFQYPFQSEHLNMWSVTKRNSTKILCSLHNVNKKMAGFSLSINNETKMYVIPLLHM